jgi:hypothetical protein
MVSVYIALRPLVSLPKAMNDILLLYTSSLDTKVKLEAATAVIQLLMMGGEMRETC